MTLSIRTAPPAGAACFRDLDDHALATADGARRYAGVGNRGKPESERCAQNNRSKHYTFLLYVGTALIERARHPENTGAMNEA
jgi:hypothetical protein